MIAHLFSKVYLSLDLTLRPIYDTLIVSSNGFSVTKSFINNHTGVGTEHGRYNDASEVNWPAFFNSVNDRRTVVYADPLNFTKIYFSFLKTTNPNISFDDAIKIFEVVLKRASFYIVRYDAFGMSQGEDAKADVARAIEQVRASYAAAWNQSPAWNLSQEFIDSHIGVEFLAAKYWARGVNEQILKDRLETIWWKIFVGWGEEAAKLYSQRWAFENTTADPLSFISSISLDENLSWMADPDLDLEKTDLFKARHGWSAVESIWNFLKNDQDKGLIIELEPHWQTVVDKNWSVILNKNTPLPLITMASEPVYRLTINSWLISYFAAQTPERLREFVS